ncbi:MAG: hypothetical protein LJF15_13195 [Acidobacteria bacterium]|jgi:hypothetical protein|nr:hypothetical protein [Acidobacteriota bacterium]
MTRTGRRKALAGLTALALAVSAFGPCLCFLNGATCHGEGPESDAHACCEKPIGVQAIGDECCDGSSTLVFASTEVPEVLPPTLQGGHIGHVPPAEQSRPVVAVPAAPSPSLDRTTVLLI